MQKSIWRTAVLATGLALAAGAVHAQQSYVYPSKGQSAQQKTKDQTECQAWAQQQTGYSANQPPATAATQAPPPPSTGRSAGRGAAIGAIGGAIGGNAGKGAAIGAGVGAIGGRARQNEAERQQEAAQAQASQQTQSMRQNYDKAFNACMEGRGYTVR